MNPKQSLERAFYAFASAHSYDSVAATSIYKGIDNTSETDSESGTDVVNRVHPSITIVADGDHEEQLLNAKLFRGQLVIRVETDGQNVTDADFNLICEDVFEKFDITTLADSVSDAAQDSGQSFYCYQANIIDNGHSIRNGVNWQNQIVLDCAYSQANL